MFEWKRKLGRPECPYLYRWNLPLPFGTRIALHKWVGSDDNRHLHDHPSNFITIVLKGKYIDMPSGELMKFGKIRLRKAEHQHYVQLVDECWTLLFWFPKRRNWGYWVPRKLDGKLKFKKSNKYFLEHGEHPCETER